MNAYRTGGDFGFANKLVYIHMSREEFHAMGDQAAKQMFIRPKSQQDFLKGWDEMNEAVPPHPVDCTCWLCPPDVQEHHSHDLGTVIQRTTSHTMGYSRASGSLRISGPGSRVDLSREEVRDLLLFLHEDLRAEILARQDKQE